MTNHVYNVSEVRSIEGIYDSAQIISIIHNYLVLNSWRISEITNASLVATGVGLHVNFKPKFTAVVTSDIKQNQTLIEIKSYASIKVATYVSIRL